MTPAQFLALSLATILALLQLPSPCECVRCFVCSAIASPTSCPKLSLDTAQLWSVKTNKYYDVQPGSDGIEISCVIGYSTKGPVQNAVFFQVNSW